MGQKTCYVCSTVTPLLELTQGRGQDQPQPQLVVSQARRAEDRSCARRCNRSCSQRKPRSITCAP